MGSKMGEAYSSLGQTKVLSATPFVLLGAKAKFLRRKISVLVAFEEILKCADPNPYYPRYTKVFCRLNVLQGLVVKGIVIEYVIMCL